MPRIATHTKPIKVQTLILNTFFGSFLGQNQRLNKITRQKKAYYLQLV